MNNGRASCYGRGLVLQDRPSCDGRDLALHERELKDSINHKDIYLFFFPKMKGVQWRQPILTLIRLTWT